ncbi:MAG TPA: hypothetical protein VMB48_04385 [Steroidobacteraceae bacterium]|nr:hypothetical protein [Steroidobacteraceae bacterium]
MAVSLVVLPPGGMYRASSPAGLAISAADVARGYVEVRRATRLTVTSLGQAGYLLDVSPTAAVFTEVLVEGVGRQVTLGSNGGTIFERGGIGLSPPLALMLDFRFTLAPGVTPGRYPWPLRFQVRPLASL